LLKAARAAVVGQVLVARSRVKWAVHQHVLHGLGQLATGASDLFWGVQREETLGVGTYKGVPSDYGV